MDRSYYLFITRRPSGNASIGLDDWQKYVAGDPELVVIDGSSARVQWSGCRGRYMIWESGEIVADDPDFVLIDKMLAIAKKLGAVVQGDDLEIYDT